MPSMSRPQCVKKTWFIVANEISWNIEVLCILVFITKAHPTNTTASLTNQIYTDNSQFLVGQPQLSHQKHRNTETSGFVHFFMSDDQREYCLWRRNKTGKFTLTLTLVKPWGQNIWWLKVNQDLIIYHVSIYKILCGIYLCKMPPKTISSQSAV